MRVMIYKSVVKLQAAHGYFSSQTIDALLY